MKMEDGFKRLEKWIEERILVQLDRLSKDSEVEVTTAEEEKAVDDTGIKSKR